MLSAESDADRCRAQGGQKIWQGKWQRQPTAQTRRAMCLTIRSWYARLGEREIKFKSTFEAEKADC